MLAVPALLFDAYSTFCSDSPYGEKMQISGENVKTCDEKNTIHDLWLVQLF
jgi:hypothetical protein